MGILIIIIDRNWHIIFMKLMSYMGVERTGILLQKHSDVHKQMYIYTHVLMCVCVRACVRACVSACMCACVHSCLHACMHACDVGVYLQLSSHYNVIQMCKHYCHSYNFILKAEISL